MTSRPSTGDLIAGGSVALVAIPQSLAYAELAGLPAHLGLFASAVPPIAAAFFVSSRQLQTGPVALTALLVFGALSPLATPFTDEYIGLAALLALLVGVMRTLLGLLKAGRVAFLLSEPVLLGFTTGAATLIVASQVPRLLDVPARGDGVLADAAWAILEPGSWTPGALLFAIGTGALVIGGRHLHQLFPGVLVAVISALLVSEFGGYNGSTVGELNGAFVALRIDFPWSSVGGLLLPALAIALVGFAEPSSIARTFAAEDREHWDADREFVSQGVANIAAGLVGAFPVGGSFSRSSINRAAGATSRWAGAVTGLVVLFALPLTPLLAALPTAVLGAVVVVAVAKLIRLAELYRIARLSGAQGLVAGGTLIATLATAPQVQYGVIIGVGLALLAHLYRELSVSAPVHRRGDRLVVAPEGVLWFATVPTIDERLRSQLVAHPDLNSVEVDLSGVGRLDYSGASALGRLAADFEERGTSVEFSHIPTGCARAAGIHLRGRHTDPLDTHWDELYRQQPRVSLGWHEETPATIPDIRAALGRQASARSVIDVGAGTSVLVDHLIALDADVTLLDRSSEALELTRKRIALNHAEAVEFVTADVTTFRPARRWSVWHDRAMFHFLTDAAERRAYVESMTMAVEPEGQAIIATFAPDGPSTCAGLPVQRYAESELVAEFESAFDVVSCRRHVGLAAAEDTRPYTICTFQRRN